MDEQEFRRLLDLFPVVRSGDYHAESASSRQAASCSASNEAIKDWQDAWHDERKETENQGTDLHDKFWQKLKLTAEKKFYLPLMHNNHTMLNKKERAPLLYRLLKVRSLPAFAEEVGAAEADKLCKAFQHVHRKLVYEGLSFEAAQKFLHS
ncbi:hypothetical protein GOBAR_DD36488 [Gossypium barbadense]|nr:hypothetical protein GOBAR_DD36488 [Gossypium barbadense]